MRFNMKKALDSQKKLSASAVDFSRINENYTGRCAVTVFHFLIDITYMISHLISMIVLKWILRK